MLTSAQYLLTQSQVKLSGYSQAAIDKGVDRANDIFKNKLSKIYYELYALKQCKYVILESYATNEQTEIIPLFSIDTDEDITLYRNVNNINQINTSTALTTESVTTDLITLTAADKLGTGDTVTGIYTHVEDDDSQFLAYTADLATYYIIKENRGAQFQFDPEGGNAIYFKTILSEIPKLVSQNYERLDFMGNIGEINGIQMISVGRK